MRGIIDFEELLRAAGYRDGFFEGVCAHLVERRPFVCTVDRLVPVEFSAHYADISWGLKLHGGNVGFENCVLTLPHYTAFLLKRFLREHGETMKGCAK